MSADFRLRDAVPADVAAIARLVRALADYEKLAHEARAGEADFHAALFGAHPCARAAVGERAGETVAFALWFTTFSTFTGRPGLWVEDVFVDPAHRGHGIGRALFALMAQRALAAGCARMEWSVLDWNAPAIAFYRALGAAPLEDWTTQRLTGAALSALAA